MNGWERISKLEKENRRLKRENQELKKKAKYDYDKVRHDAMREGFLAAQAWFDMGDLQHLENSGQTPI